MIQYEHNLTIAELIPTSISAGILLMGVILFIYMYAKSGKLLHLAMLLMAFFGFGFVFSETMILVTGQWIGNAKLGMNIHRIEQLFATFTAIGLPLLLYSLLELKKKWQKINIYITLLGVIFSITIIIISIVSPDLFVSQTTHKATFDTFASRFARGKEGPFYIVRDAYIGILIIYSIVCFSYDLFVRRRSKYVLSPFIGILMAIYGAIIDILNIYSKTDKELYEFMYNIDYFHGIEFARFAIGLTIFILTLMGSILRQFFDMSNEVAVARKKADFESEKNYRQNKFIKEVLKKNSRELINSTEQLSSTISDFTENTQEQAAATEEVTASIEQVTAGIDNVKVNADEQYSSLENLSSTMEVLSKIIVDMGGLVQQSLHTIDSIAENARAGEHSLIIMNDSMDKISSSSKEITGIIQIINDISDRINLLSLNASIEAARAGEAGRGFAVVADEVSKLADQTASSIKNIDQLIHTNENEIITGIQNITNAVEKIDKIIHDMDEFIKKIKEMSNYMDQQNAANETVNNNADKVKNLSEQIMTAMSEQKSAINEISRSVNSINELSQNNTFRIFEITDSSRSLVAMVENLNKDIDDYKND